MIVIRSISISLNTITVPTDHIVIHPDVMVVPSTILSDIHTIPTSHITDVILVEDTVDYPGHVPLHPVWGLNQYLWVYNKL